MTEGSHFIAGQSVAGEGEVLDDINPSTGKAIGRFREATLEQAETAVAAAARSFATGIWADAPISERQAVMRRSAIAIRDNADALVDLQVAEGGMVPTGVRGQVMGGAAWFDYFADFLGREAGEMFRQLGRATTLVERVPIGVCALFSPWNVPVTLSAIKLAPALAAGNSVVLKPSEKTPMVTRRLVDLLHQAGLPDGVLNCVNGRGATTGAALAGARGVDMISFTGGAVGGLAVAEAAARACIPCVMELGGKSATVIFDDADMDAALDGTLMSIYASNGEACLAGSRILVQETIAADFMPRFAERAKALRVGDPREDGIDIGPMITAAHLQRVLEFYESAQAEGDRILFGGAAEEAAEGFFVNPGAIEVASTASRVWREEVFGPLAAIMTFATEDEAIALANDSDHGLAGYLWTRDLDRAMRVSRRVRTGTMMVNSTFLRELNAPFGGFKASGIGREGGLHSWMNFTEAKTTVIRNG